jgi:hypothetical protein
MSESELKDQLITDLCIRWQMQNQACDEVYGNIIGKVSDGKLK